MGGTAKHRGTKQVKGEGISHIQRNHALGALPAVLGQLARVLPVLAWLACCALTRREERLGNPKSLLGWIPLYLYPRALCLLKPHLPLHTHTHTRACTRAHAGTQCLHGL